MTDFERQDGISFLLLSFTRREEFYYMKYQEMMRFWNRMQEGERAFAGRSWMRTVSFPAGETFWSLTWISWPWICKRGEKPHPL